MLRLRKVLLCDYLFYCVFLLVSLITIIRVNLKPKLYFNNQSQIFSGKIKSLELKSTSIKIIIKGKEKLLLNYYFDDDKKLINTYHELGLGDYIEVQGKGGEKHSNCNPNQFNYEKYLQHKNIYHQITVQKILTIKKTNNPLLLFKDSLIKYLDTLPNKEYIKAFSIGINEINRDINNLYQDIGISHLLAISGSQISMVVLLFVFIFKKIKLDEDKTSWLLIIIILFYMFLSSFIPSLIRSGVFIILLLINKIFYFFIKPLNIFLLSISLIILVNPKIIYDLGFIYSSVISFFFILNMNNFSKNPIKVILETTLIAFLVSFPITIYYNFELNLISLLANLFYVPYISFVLFPICLINIIIPLPRLTKLLIDISEGLARILIKLPTNIIVRRPSIFFIILVFILIFGFFLTKYKKISLFLIFLLFIINLIIPKFYQDYVLVFDIGQGDATLINIKGENILIDTGGNINSNYDLLTPILKSLGINKLEFLILTHGDYDHIGNTFKLIDKIKVEEVIFNCGPYNDLEKDLIKVLDKKKIKYQKNIKSLKIKNQHLYFLNTFIYKDENNNSNVIYLNYYNHKFLFMGDAGILREKDILTKYNIQNIAFLKVGHHGSNTSSSKEFINKMNPKYSLISVGQNNHYGHPKEEVLNILKKSKIYRTDIDGSIEIKINKNGYKIRTCSP